MNLSVSNRLASFFKEYGVYLLIFVVVFSLRVCAISHKNTFFFDDPASFNVSTPHNLYKDGSKIKYGWADLRFEYGVNHKVGDLKKTLFQSDSDLKSIWRDLVFLHNKTLDRQHPNLYYSILRVWTAGMDISNPHSMIVRGCSLNLIFFMFSYFFMYKLLSLIKKDKKFISLGLFFAFVTTGSISNSMMIRPYPLTEAFFILAMYIFVVLYNSVNSEDFFTPKKVLKYALAFALLLLTTYYSLLFAGFVLITITYKCMQAKNFKMLGGVFAMFGLALLFVLLFCPLYFANFASIEHMNETKAAANFWNFTNFRFYGKYLMELLNRFIFNNIALYMILFVLAIIGLPIFDKTKSFTDTELKNFALIYATTLLYAYLIVTICPFHEIASARYITPFMPVIGLIWAFVTYHFRIGHAIAMVLITFVTSYFPIMENLSMLNSKYKNLGAMSYYNDFFWLDHSILTHDGNNLRPVVIINRNWIWPNFILYFDNDTIVRFEDKLDSEHPVFDNFVLIDRENASIVRKK